MEDNVKPLVWPMFCKEKMIKCKCRKLAYIVGLVDPLTRGSYDWREVDMKTCHHHTITTVMMERGDVGIPNGIMIP